MTNSLGSPRASLCLCIESPHDPRTFLCKLKSVALCHSTHRTNFIGQSLHKNARNIKATGRWWLLGEGRACLCTQFRRAVALSCDSEH